MEAETAAAMGEWIFIDGSIDSITFFNEIPF